jgi:hypothetical protein
VITVTARAKEELKRMGERLGLEPGKHLRLATPPVWTGEGDFGIVKAEEWHGDHVVEFQGSVVLLVDADLVERMPTAVLDFKDSPAGTRFMLDVF